MASCQALLRRTGFRCRATACFQGDDAKGLLRVLSDTTDSPKVPAAGLLIAEMEWISEVLQRAVVVERRRSFPLEPQ